MFPHNGYRRKPSIIRLIGPGWGTTTVAETNAGVAATAVAAAVPATVRPPPVMTPMAHHQLLMGGEWRPSFTFLQPQSSSNNLCRNATRPVLPATLQLRAQTAANVCSGSSNRTSYWLHPSAFDFFSRGARAPPPPWLLWSCYGPMGPGVVSTCTHRSFSHRAAGQATGWLSIAGLGLSRHKPNSHGAGSRARQGLHVIGAHRRQRVVTETALSFCWHFGCRLAAPATNITITL